MNEPRMTGSGPVVPRGLAVPRDAATVILLRQEVSADDGGGVEAFLLRRTAELEFAPGAYVFPGGSVDARDADPGVGWAGPGPADFAALLDVPPDRARALVCAAVRETFEESGVLLAGASHDDLVGDSAALAADRHALPAGQDATAAPEGHADPGESESGSWLRPASALEAAQAGQMTLLPPTAVTLGELAGHPDVPAILARRQVITPRLPKVIVEDGRVRLALPGSGPQPGPGS